VSRENSAVLLQREGHSMGDGQGLALHPVVVVLHSASTLSPRASGRERKNIQTVAQTVNAPGNNITKNPQLT
jgi:hypothetical protein